MFILKLLQWHRNIHQVVKLIALFLHFDIEAFSTDIKSTESKFCNFDFTIISHFLLKIQNNYFTYSKMKIIL